MQGPGLPPVPLLELTGGKRAAGLVLDHDYLTKRIVLENVTHFAYGQHNDGEVGFWVAGRAGWFSISPARGYRPMFNDVVEAIDLFYFLADRHQSKRRKGKNWNPSVEYLLEEVSVLPNGCDKCAAG